MRIDTPKFIQVLNLGVQGSYELSQPVISHRSTLIGLDVEGTFWMTRFNGGGPLLWDRLESGEWKD